jgi:thiol:disulfide interchange protein|tara:strand:- start:613 stop:1047 length:435 start_codon:yes stop_codon:yes gene_type:complete
MYKKVNALLKKVKKNFDVKTLLFIIALLFLYYIYINYLDEGFESSCDNLNEDIKDDKKLVLFYANWCGHCKNIKPVWDETASEINTDNNNKMLKLNVGDGKPEQKEMMEKYNISGFPTIIMFENGENKGVLEKRDKNSFLEYFN